MLAFSSVLVSVENCDATSGHNHTEAIRRCHDAVGGSSYSNLLVRWIQSVDHLQRSSCLGRFAKDETISANKA